MIEFEITKDCLILKYLSEPNNDWLIEGLNNDEIVTLKHTFRFSKNDLYRAGPIQDDPDMPIEFVLGRLSGDYFKIDGRIMGTDISVFLDKSIRTSIKFFIAVKNISVFKQISEVLTEDIFIGGNNAAALPETEFRKLIKNFPNTYELKKYAKARISAVLKNYADSIIDGEKKYNTYMNRKISQKGLNLSEEYKYYELEKYKAILHKLEKMLDSEESYNEKQWQAEILQIILLLYPKYICAFPEAPVRDTYNDKNRT